jgi:malate dehydrogenase (oxaloacetate-decarboxylating)
MSRNAAMMEFRLRSDPQTREDVLDVPFVGAALLRNPLFNKGSAFSEQERRAFRLVAEDSPGK